jgi:membrane-bound lytic murein transglycosylase B
MKVLSHLKLQNIARFSSLVLCLGFLASAGCANNSGVASEQALDAQRAGFSQWLVSFKREAVEMHGFSQSMLDEAFSGVTFNERVIKLDGAQPDRVYTFAQYKERVLPDSRVELARKKYQEHKVLLDRIGEQYGVQPRFIVALWALESNFGQNMGGFSVIESLATLAYEGRRADFFKSELIHALSIIKQGDVSASDMKGSWAGAMGQSQFMPSSYTELAVDFDGNGKRDIWGTHADVFASIANYLSKRGWDESATWGREVLLPKGFDTKLLGRDTEKTIRQWHELGVRMHTGTVLPSSRDDLVASIVRPETDSAPNYMVYGNYKTIMQWNRSLYFATTVGLLSDKIGNL